MECFVAPGKDKALLPWCSHINCCSNVGKMESERDYVGKNTLFLSAFFSVDVRRNAHETFCQSLSCRAACGVLGDPGLASARCRVSSQHTLSHLAGCVTFLNNSFIAIQIP